MSFSCENMGSCPTLNLITTSTRISRLQPLIAEYCLNQEKYRECMRYKMKEKGEKSHDNLLPNGKKLEFQSGSLLNFSMHSSHSIEEVQASSSEASNVHYHTDGALYLPDDVLVLCIQLLLPQIPLLLIYTFGAFLDCSVSKFWLSLLL